MIVFEKVIRQKCVANIAYVFTRYQHTGFMIFFMDKHKDTHFLKAIGEGVLEDDCPLQYFTL